MSDRDRRHRMGRTWGLSRHRCRGRGTEVNPPDAWTSLEAIVRANLSDSEPGVLSKKLLEARRIIAIGSVELAAQRRTDKHLLGLYELLEAMRSAADRGDVAALAEADIEFHHMIMKASGNVFLPLLFNSFSPLLPRGAVPDLCRPTDAAQRDRASCRDPGFAEERRPRTCQDRNDQAHGPDRAGSADICNRCRRSVRAGIRVRRATPRAAAPAREKLS